MKLDPQEEAIRGSFDPKHLHDNVYNPQNQESEVADQLFFIRAMLTLLGMAVLLTLANLFN